MGCRINRCRETEVAASGGGHVPGSSRVNKSAKKCCCCALGVIVLLAVVVGLAAGWGQYGNSFWSKELPEFFTQQIPDIAKKTWSSLSDVRWETAVVYTAVGVLGTLAVGGVVAGLCQLKKKCCKDDAAGHRSPVAYQNHGSMPGPFEDL